MMQDNYDLLMDAGLVPCKVLKTGNLTCMYEAGNLRCIKSGDVEIVRMIYGTLRDENWETITAKIMDETLEENVDGFQISYTALYTTNDIHYTANFYIEGNADNTIVFSMKGIALNEFKKNRIGLCVLHPLKECCGKTVIITKPNGESYESIFPELIAAQQPFKEVHQMQWQPAKNLSAQLLFSGDIFETEDQRNWSDSSFKTYCTPLHIPFPALIKKGNIVEQTVSLKLSGHVKEPHIASNVKNENKAGFPKIGYAKPLYKNITKSEPLKLFKQYAFHHYRVEINMLYAAWETELDTALKESILLQTRLELILFFDEVYEQQIHSFLEKVKGFEQHIYSVLLLQHNYKITPAALMLFGYNRIKQTFPFIQVGYGTDAYFAELNRNRPNGLPHDFVSFSLTPQVHATDRRTTIENLEGQQDIIKTIQSFTGKAIHVSPVSLHKRKNFDATSKQSNFIEIPAPSQQTVFEKRWMEYTVLQLNGADCISFYR